MEFGVGNANELEQTPRQSTEEHLSEKSQTFAHPSAINYS